ncbi:MAG: hypothetical protein E6K80_06270 [Candidatus Eisenbacteria bacterium]|uniref:Uncharacterized protein n=1 Tax=Eiseniibacteriota bacterium TaxID=2212470 RepID=A0A538U5Q0_UNCEI|nr:MAG: hypothetical protein E6K80_06270 [Candidatus Eisenbacteria bacterium]
MTTAAASSTLTLGTSVVGGGPGAICPWVKGDTPSDERSTPAGGVCGTTGTGTKGGAGEELSSSHHVLGEVDRVADARVGAERLHLLERHGRQRITLDVEHGGDPVHAVVGRDPSPRPRDRGALVDVVALPDVGRLVVVLGARVPLDEHLVVARGDLDHRTVGRARQVEVGVVRRLHGAVVALHERHAGGRRRALGDHDPHHDFLGVSGRHGEGAAGEHEASVGRGRVEESSMADRISGDVERGRLSGIVVGLGRVLRAAAIRILVERRQTERDAGDFGPLEEVVSDRGRLVSVLLVVVVAVVDEADRQRGVAADQVVGESAQIGIRPLRDVGVRQGVPTAVDDLVMDEDGVAQRALAAEGEGRLLDLDPQGQPAAGAVVGRALVEVVEHRPQHLIARDAERAVRLDRHRRRPVRHRPRVVIREHGVPRRRVDVAGRVEVHAVQLVDLVLGLGGIVLDSAHRLPGLVVVAVLGDGYADLAAHQSPHPQAGGEYRGLSGSLGKLEPRGSVLGVIGE